MEENIQEFLFRKFKKEMINDITEMKLDTFLECLEETPESYRINISYLKGYSKNSIIDELLMIFLKNKNRCGR